MLTMSSRYAPVVLKRISDRSLTNSMARSRRYQYRALTVLAFDVSGTLVLVSDTSIN